MTHPAGRSAAKRLLDPATLAGYAGVMAAGYVLVQTAFRALLAALGQVRWQLGTVAGDLRFAAAAAGVGACVGAGLYATRRMREGWLRRWMESSLRMTALAFMVTTMIRLRFDAAWLVALTLTSLAVGLLNVGVIRAMRSLTPAGRRPPAP